MSRAADSARVTLEMTIGRVLRVGVVASSVCLAAGLLLALTVADNVAAETLLTAGVLMLLATPAARVVVSVMQYARDRDWLFAALTSVVLLELAVSVIAAAYGWKL